MEPNHKPLHHRIRHHITRTSQVCDEWCREARMYDRILPTAFLGGVLVFLLYFVTIASPLAFPGSSLLRVKEGTTVVELAHQLKEKNYIHSELIFRGFVRLFGDDKIVAGEYFFPGSDNVVHLALRFINGDHELVPIRVRIVEGSNSIEIAELLSKKIPDFDAETFLSLAQPKEGMLFPDTYFFLPGEAPEIVVSSLVNNFKIHIADPKIQDAITTFGKPLNEILTMASLLEKEAGDTKSRQQIAGLLWRRLEIGMKLQVDAAFLYINGVSTFDLTKKDLATTSPYNTYVHKGLPPGPITNPSMSSILAAVTPIKTKNLFYLSDRQSNLYFCPTYACHLANQRKYLSN